MSEDTAIDEPQVEDEQQLDQGEEQDPQEPEEPAAQDDEIIVQIGEKEPEEDEEEKQIKTMPPWVKDIRRNLYHQKKENEKLQRELETLKGAAQPQRVDPGPKPTLSGCDYDEDVLNQKLDAWYESKRRADDFERETQRRQQQIDDRWRQKMRTFEEKKQSLKVKDWEDIDLAVTSTLNPHQQAMIISGADNSALLFYALGKNQKKLKDLAAIEDPIQFAFAVAKVEASLKVTERKPAVQPEKTISSGGAPMTSPDKTLERLRAEAERTGDNSKVMAYRRKIQQQSRRK